VSAWCIGELGRRELLFAGDGGETLPQSRIGNLVSGGTIEGGAQWAPDGSAFAFLARRDGETQLWIVRPDGTGRRKITDGTADVQRFEWMPDGAGIRFAIGPTRAALAAAVAQRDRRGYNYDGDLSFFTDFMDAPIWPSGSDALTWYVLDLAPFRTTPVQEQAEPPPAAAGPVPAPASPPAGAEAPSTRAMVSIQGDVLALTLSSGRIVTCRAAACASSLRGAWLSSDGRRVFFWRAEDLNDAGHVFYAWDPERDAVAPMLSRPDDDIAQCDMGANDILICVRETKVSPPELWTVDFRARTPRTLVNLNPQFASIRLGRVERIEWATPHFAWTETGPLAGLYPARAYGYILYPPDFDPNRRYPVIVEPYIAHGFASLDPEHALHVYAANGFVVLNLAFPFPVNARERLGSDAMRVLYSRQLNFPHLSMLTASTIAGLDLVARRGFIAPDRVGFGGVSHGTFVPAYMMLKHDRIAAISLSSPIWGPHEYYWATARGLGEGSVGRGWRPRPESDREGFWTSIDLADHVDQVEAPILLNLSAGESYALVRLLRNLLDSHLPYDAYVYPAETHIKWQPAHLESVMQRNLDWFRFWLQDIEDPDPSKAEQYVRWRELRAAQCRNPRSLRDYCSVESLSQPTAH
jgi:dipeptidyl aminopeptidase/acylaminoacyl peptidase